MEKKLELIQCREMQVSCELQDHHGRIKVTIVVEEAVHEVALKEVGMLLVRLGAGFVAGETPPPSPDFVDKRATSTGPVN
jgi:hypothetical protein